MVFYCNGRTCEKSYRAALKAKQGGLSQVFAFDGGIPDWANAYPKETELLGKPLNDTAKLIGKEQFEAHLLDPKDFAERVGKNGVAIDARDRFQRNATGLFIGREKQAPFDDRAAWKRIVAEAGRHGKPLLIYDEVGKQVRWLQYFLEEEGVKAYYFMKGGAKGFFESLR